MDYSSCIIGYVLWLSESKCLSCLILSKLKHEFADYVEQLPLSNTPKVFGLHANAEISYFTEAARDIFVSLIELQPQIGECGSA